MKDKDGKEIASFFFNMKGFVPNFELANQRGVLYSFFERAQKTQIKEFKNAINSGYTRIKLYG